eukprot:366366-Chlamydomonas_euryale.AAC.11
MKSRSDREGSSPFTWPELAAACRPAILFQPHAHEHVLYSTLTQAPTVVGVWWGPDPCRVSLPTVRELLLAAFFRAASTSQVLIPSCVAHPSLSPTSPTRPACPKSLRRQRFHTYDSEDAAADGTLPNAFGGIAMNAAGVAIVAAESVVKSEKERSTVYGLELPATAFAHSARMLP